MPYTLGIAFEYYRYKHDAVMRVFADDYLISEVSLNDHIKLKCVDLREGPDTRNDVGPHNTSRVMFVPKKIFTFSIDEQYLKKKIRIEIKNNNNNHTNGFMTDYSYLIFHKIFLIPDCLFDESSWCRLDKFDNRFVEWWPEIQYFPHDFIEYLYTTDGSSPDLLEMPPNGSHFLYHAKKGGSFSIQIALSQKHNIIHLGRPRPGKMYLTRTVERLLWVYGLLNIIK